MEVQLTSDQKALARRAVESGRIRSEEEAVREALALWEDRERQRLAFLATLECSRTSLAEGEGRVITQEKLKVLWPGCGTEDAAYKGVKGMDDLLTGKNVKHVFNPSGGGHSWPNWQVYLSKYAPLLFQN